MDRRLPLRCFLESALVYLRAPWTLGLLAILFCTASAFATAPAAPTNLRAVVTGSSSVAFLLEDNSTDETAFEVTYAEGANAPASFTLNGAHSGTGTYEIDLSGFLANTNYTLQIRAVKGSEVSAYTNTVNFNIGALNAPGSFSVVPLSDSSIFLTWVDNAYAESGYFVEYWDSASGTWLLAGTIDSSNSISHSFTGLPPSTTYRLRMGAYNQTTTGTSRSNEVTVTTPFYPPSNLVATPSATSPSQISFTWQDNSSAEYGYELLYRIKNDANPQSFTSRKVVAANITSICNLPEFQPGTTYEFCVRAFSANSYSDISPIATATTLNGFTSKPYAPITLGSAFSYQLSTQSQTGRTSWNVTSLPAGLSFDSASGVISGTATVAGVFTAQLTANFVGGSSATQPLVLRVIVPPAAPQIVATIPTQTLTQSGSTTIALGTKFADPDTESAVRMATSKGNLDIVLYSKSTPLTVANFLSYTSNYANSIFHRAPTGFVLQGGGYQLYNSTPAVYARIPAQAPVVNEPGISNLVGTLAMAKVADDPNSATSEFFFNLGDNSANLDAQNGGFTVFGRVAAPSLTGALTALAYVSTTTANLNIYTGPQPTDVVSTSFADLPTDTDGSHPLVTSVTSLPVLTYSVTSAPNSAVATATLSGSNLQIRAVAPGATSVTVGATDVDGNTTTQTFAINVQGTIAQWAAAQGYSGTQASPSADPNANGLTNLQEFAFMAEPTTGAQAQLPKLTLKAVASANYGEITFPVRKFTAGLTYAVEASNTLSANDWTTLWTSTEGFAASAVSGAVDQTDRTVVTVRDAQPTSASSRRFLRVKITGQ